MERGKLNKEYKNIACRIVEEIKSYPGVEGICLSGSVSRGFTDRYSDIDLLIYFNHTGYRKLVEKRLDFPIARLGSKYKGIVIDVQWLDLSEEMKRQWTDIEKWDRSYCLILFERKKIIRKLFASKLHHLKKKRNLRLFNLLSEIKHNLELSQTMIKNKCLVVSQLIMNKILYDILNSTFILNNEYTPIEKWQLHLVYSLPWIPSCFKKDKVFNSLNLKMNIQQSFARYYLLKKSYKECQEKTQLLTFME